MTCTRVLTWHCTARTLSATYTPLSHTTCSIHAHNRGTSTVPRTGLLCCQRTYSSSHAHCICRFLDQTAIRLYHGEDPNGNTHSAATLASSRCERLCGPCLRAKEEKRECRTSCHGKGCGCNTHIHALTLTDLGRCACAGDTAAAEQHRPHARTSTSLNDCRHRQSAQVPSSVCTRRSESMAGREQAAQRGSADDGWLAGWLACVGRLCL